MNTLIRKKENAPWQVGFYLWIARLVQYLKSSFLWISVWIIYLFHPFIFKLAVVVAQSLSCVLLFETPWPAACEAFLSFTISQSLFRLLSIESIMPSNHLILCRPLLLLSSIFPSIRVFSSESALHIRWPKYWSFSFSISPSNEYSGLTSFRMDWFDFLAAQGTLKSPFQYGYI